MCLHTVEKLLADLDPVDPKPDDIKQGIAAQSFLVHSVSENLGTLRDNFPLYSRTLVLGVVHLNILFDDLHQGWVGVVQIFPHYECLVVIVSAMQKLEIPTTNRKLNSNISFLLLFLLVQAEEGIAYLSPGQWSCPSTGPVFDE